MQNRAPFLTFHKQSINLLIISSQIFDQKQVRCFVIIRWDCSAFKLYRKTTQVEKPKPKSWTITLDKLVSKVMCTKPINFKRLFWIGIYARDFILVLVFNSLLKRKIFISTHSKYQSAKILKLLCRAVFATFTQLMKCFTFRHSHSFFRLPKKIFSKRVSYKIRNTF